jgi:hypothetical protein
MFSDCVSGLDSRNCTYSERLDIIHRDLVTAEMEKSILEHASMAVAEQVLVGYCGKYVNSSEEYGGLRTQWLCLVAQNSTWYKIAAFCRAETGAVQFQAVVIVLQAFETVLLRHDGKIKKFGGSAKSEIE